MTSSSERVAIDFDEARVDALFASLAQDGLPGATVGIAIAGRPVYRKGFGLASLELPVRLSPTLRLRVGSVTKQFTCLALMLLCEEGKARLDDPIGRFVPGLHPVSSGVTLRQLMGHTSGVRDVYSLFDRFNDDYSCDNGAAQSVKSADLLEQYRDIDDVDAPPGSAWIYNNGGYLLLSAAIERIAGQSLEEVFAERIFQPLGMHDSLLMRSDGRFVSNRGSQHVVNPAGGYERLSWGMDNYLGGGAVVSTVDDLLGWMRHMDAPTVGTPDTWAVMTTPQVLTNGTTTAYGLGLQIDRYRGVQTLSHTGNALGGSAQVLKVPAAKLDVVVLVNRQDLWVGTLTRQILDACLPEGVASRPAPSANRSFARGTFRSRQTGRVIQLSAGTFRVFGEEPRQIVSIDGMDLPFDADETGVLCFDWASGEKKQTLTLLGDPAAPERIVLSDFGHPDELIRLPDDLSAADEPLGGRYQADAIGVRATIHRSSGELQLHTAGKFGAVSYRLEHLAGGVLRARPARPSRVGFIGGLVTFDTDKRGFRFSSYQMRSLLFRRCD